jgi:hypothetical protein
MVEPPEISTGVDVIVVRFTAPSPVISGRCREKKGSRDGI